MNESILIGQGLNFNRMSYETWQKNLKHIPLEQNPRFTFMTPEHHKVRYFVVRELPKRGTPIHPETISMELGISFDRTTEILDELEKNLFFLVRNKAGEVQWAFPVTAEKTPHKLKFKSGESLYAA